MSSRRPRCRRPGQPVLRISGVNHHFGTGDTRTQVLFDNTLEVMPGELVIMSGPSGSGKTTLLTLIGGLRTLQDGEIEVWDADAGELPHAPRHRGTGAGQRPPADRVHLPAAQPVRLAHRDAERPHGPAAEADGRRPRRRRPRPARSTCSSATRDIDGKPQKPRFDYKPAALSGGQRQRVADRPGARQPAEARAGRRADRGARRQHRPRGRHAAADTSPASGPTSELRAARPARRGGRRERPARGHGRCRC